MPCLLRTPFEFDFLFEETYLRDYVTSFPFPRNGEYQVRKIFWLIYVLLLDMLYAIFNWKVDIFVRMYVIVICYWNLWQVDTYILHRCAICWRWKRVDATMSAVLTASTILTTG